MLESLQRGAKDEVGCTATYCISPPVHFALCSYNHFKSFSGNRSTGARQYERLEIRQLLLNLLSTTIATNIASDTNGTEPLLEATPFPAITSQAPKKGT